MSEWLSYRQLFRHVAGILRRQYYLVVLFHMRPDFTLLV